MTWFYEIRDSNHFVASSGNGFDSNKAAMAAGRKKARELKASGSLSGGGIATVKAEQTSEALVSQISETPSLDNELTAAKVPKS